MDLVLSFYRDRERETADSGQRWQAKFVRGSRRDRKVTVYAVDRESANVPTSPDQQWRCVVTGDGPRVREGCLTLSTVSLEERLSDGPFALQFCWQGHLFRRPGAEGVFYRWEATADGGPSNTVYVLDDCFGGRVKPDLKTGDTCFLCRITRLIPCDNGAENRLVAVKILQSLPALDAVRPDEAVRILSMGIGSDRPTRRPRRKNELVAVAC